MRLVLVVGGARDLRVGCEGGQDPVGARLREQLDVEVGERDHGADVVARAQLGEEGDVAGVVDARWRDAVLRGVLRGRKRVRIGGDRRRELREAGDDVVALADAGEEDGLAGAARGRIAARPVRRSAHVRHPPVSPL